jgi:hypothetical protein
MSVIDNNRKLNYLAILVATIVAFVASALWYSVIFGKAYASLRGGAPVAPEPWQILVEFAKTLVVAYVVARFLMLFTLTGPSGSKAALSLTAWLWIFPVMILLGSILHENVPWGLGAIHAGDWLMKLLVMALILSIWRTETTAK